MTVPTPTNQYLDITNGTFTENGAPGQSNDQHGLSNTYNFDGVNDYLSSSEVPFSASTSQFSFAFWIKKNADGVNMDYISTRPTINNGQYIYPHTNNINQLAGIVQNSGGGFLRSVATTTVTVADGWTHVVMSFDLSTNDVNIYKNGVEVSYRIQNQVSGSVNATMTAHTLGIASTYNDSFGAGRGVNGRVSRLKVWDGTILSASQVLEEYTNEFGAVVVPTAAFSSDNLTDSGTWTEGGSAFSNAIDDQHNPNAGIDFDGIDDEINATGVLQNGDEELTMSCWFKTGASTSNGWLVNQWHSSNRMNGLAHKNGAIEFRAGGNTSFNAMRSKTTFIYNDDQWYHVLATRRGSGTTANIDIYINGVEATYASGEDSRLFGTGPLAVDATLAATRLYMGGRSDGAVPYEGIGSRVRVWRAELSAAQANKEYDNELALIGSGFGGLGGLPDLRELSRLFSKDFVRDFQR